MGIAYLPIFRVRNLKKYKQQNGNIFQQGIQASLNLILLLGISLLQGKPPEWQDFIGITTLLLTNSTVCYVLENNAGAASAALMARLAPKAKVLTTLEQLSG